MTSILYDLLTTNYASQIYDFCYLKCYFVFFPFELMKGKLQLNNVVASDVKEKDQLKMLTLP